MSSTSRPLKLVFLNIIFAMLLFELSSFLFFTISEKKLTSAKNLFKKTFPVNSLSSDNCSWEDPVGLHPYLTVYYPLKSSCEHPARNSFGFVSRDFPKEHDSNYYTLLITGASVAEQIAHPMDKNHPSIYLENVLNQNWVSPTKKPFRVISAALAGTHQPAILIQSLLFSHLADAVVSVEGYNEHFAINNTLTLEIPSDLWRQLSFSTEHPIKYFIKKSLMSFIKKMQRSFLKNSYFFLAVAKISRFAFISFSQADFGAQNPFPVTYSSVDDFSKKFESSYRRFFIYNATILKSLKKPYTVFIQPAPYQFKKLTPQELIAVQDLSHQRSYDEIKSILSGLRKDNIRVESLERVFENVTETLYVDQIHTNRKGVYLISSAIAERLAKIYGYRRK